MLNYTKLHITYSNPNDHSDQLVIDYRLRLTLITQKWVERVLTAQQRGYNIDDPARFYGFNSVPEQTDRALTDINRLIGRLNQWVKIDYYLHSVNDQDILNRLHHIFEIEHGLLDKKCSDTEYTRALCHLNLLVHRCESIARGAHPRHVVTYFGLPKTEVLTATDYQYFESNTRFGSVYINYVEIGKTLFDLMMDNDSYIKPAAFQPFCHYSADFVVKFWDNNDDLHKPMQIYYNKHKEFFTSNGHTWDDLSQSIGSIPVADLEYTGNILADLETRQFVKAVDFS